MQQALKFLVAFMGILILIGLGVIMVTIARRTTAPAHRETGFKSLALDLPAGSHVADMDAAGDRLVLHVVLPGGRERIVVVDLVSGRLLGSIDLGGGN